MNKLASLLDECLANELFLLEELAEISCEEFTDSLDFDGFLPRYNTEKADFSKIYADRIHNIAKYGYGIYSQYHVFVIDNGKIVPVEYPDSISLSQLSGYERERERSSTTPLLCLPASLQITSCFTATAAPANPRP